MPSSVLSKIKGRTKDRKIKSYLIRFFIVIMSLRSRASENATME